MKVFICSPNLDQRISLNGISANTIFIIKHNADFQYVHFEQGKRNHERRGGYWLYRILRNFLIWMIKLITTKKCIVHYNLPLNKPALKRDLPFIFFALFLKKRIILHLHGGIYLMDQKPKGLMYLLIKFLLKQNNPVIVLSLKEKKNIENWYDAKQVFVLPNCIDQPFAAINLDKFKNREIRNILFLGRIVSSKGFEYVYESLELLIKDGFKFRFYLAGDGDLLSEYHPKLKKLLGNQFEFQGVVTGNAKQNLLTNSHIFLLPSISGEGLPISLIEAMYNAVIPIVTDDGSMSTLIKNGVNGFVIPKRNSIELKVKISELLVDSDQLLRLGLNANESIKDLFKPEQYIIELNKIYSYA